jgi:hypothetical protein
MLSPDSARPVERATVKKGGRNAGVLKRPTQQGRRVRSTRRPVIVALRRGELANAAVAKPCLPCHVMGRAGLSEARCVAIVSGQRSPTT